MLPFNSQAPHFLQRAKVYCTKVLPLVFDNSLSYYEFLCRVCHKLNETIEAVNAQNLNIIEFEKMVQLEIEKFEAYIESRQTDFENEIKTEWAAFKDEFKTEWETFKTELETEWAEEQERNAAFRAEITAAFDSFKNDVNSQITAFKNAITQQFNTYKETVNAEIEQFENTVNVDLAEFKTTMQTQQNEFETHMVSLFTDFTTDEQNARSDFEANFQQLFEQWKVDTLAALNSSIGSWETETTERLTALINSKTAEIETSVKSWVQGYTADITRALALETEDRKRVDEDLQNQINQLTPTGSIKADIPDSGGNSQLYTIDTETGERTDIFPATKNSGEIGYNNLDTFSYAFVTPLKYFYYALSGEYVGDGTVINTNEQMYVGVKMSIKRLDISSVRMLIENGGSGTNVEFYRYTGELNENENIDTTALELISTWTITNSALEWVTIKTPLIIGNNNLVIKFTARFQANKVSFNCAFNTYAANDDERTVNTLPVTDFMTPVTVGTYQTQIAVDGTTETVHNFTLKIGALNNGLYKTSIKPVEALMCGSIDLMTHLASVGYKTAYSVVDGANVLLGVIRIPPTEVAGTITFTCTIVDVKPFGISML